MALYSVITGSGSYLPTHIVTNEAFHGTTFLDKDGSGFPKSSEEIVERFEQITTIKERRYVTDDLLCSDIATIAAKAAIADAGINVEDIHHIIVAHNWGDIKSDNNRSDQVPTIASRVKHNLGIENPDCIPYDLPFGCPGWVQGLIHANYFLRAGDGTCALVIGAETLSRVVDPHDRDKMLYADGAGAVILQARESDSPVGIVTYKTRSDTKDHAYLLWQQKSFNPDMPDDELYLKMNGHTLYKYALGHVPEVVKHTIDQAGIGLGDISKVLIHQANAKMDEAILQRLFKLYHSKDVPAQLMPLTVGWLGNSSVATVPTLYDLIMKGQLEGQHMSPGDWIIIASVGAGMNINSIVYKMP
ncbi:MAG: ketoacyl-ACP synthase III [Bacteroidia bacterium]|nr:ketoacyl-ACP synthase III [Bacteroidia bacterium]